MCYTEIRSSGCSFSKNGDIAGIVTLSDLNKPAACVGLFPLVQRVELSMRQAVAKLLPGDKWIDHCHKDRQRRIRNIAKNRRDRDCDIDSLSIALFSDLTHVCSTGRVAGQCFEARADATLDEERKLLDDLRNRVCHSVTSLLDDEFGIEKIAEAISVAQCWSDSLGQP